MIRFSNAGGGQPNFENIEVGPSVKTLSRYSFYNLSTIKTLKLPNTIENIENNAFYNIKTLTSLNLPKSIKNIENQAIVNSSFNINYNGTIKEWNLINKDSSWISNSSFIQYVNCIDGSIHI